MPPVAFDALGVGLSPNESPAMRHTPMGKADASHFAIAGEFIGMEPCTPGHMVLEDALDFSGRSPPKGRSASVPGLRAP